MSKFNVGDRVAVYGPTVDTHWPYDGELGTLVAMNEHSINSAEVQLDIGKKEFFHPKQCRKLKPKKRREVWVATSYFDEDYDRITAFKSPDAHGLFVRFIEAPKKKSDGE